MKISRQKKTEEKRASRCLPEKRMEWPELSERLRRYNEGDYSDGKIGRTPEVDAAYAREQNTDFLQHLFDDGPVHVSENLFPYRVSPNIAHLLVWVQNPEKVHEIRQKLDQINGLIHFENPPEWKSVPSIRHVQVFVRMQPSYRLNQIMKSLTKFLSV